MATENKNPIPFGKAMRVGNYKIWRSRTSVSYMPTEEQRKKVREESGGTKKAVPAKFEIDVLNVSNLDGTWSVKIPSTINMYANILLAFDEEEKRRDEFLTMLFGNMLSVCTVSNPYVHDAFNFLMSIMQNPYMLLSEKEMVKKFKEGFKKAGEKDKKKIDAYIEQMCKMRTQLYEMVEKKKADFIADYEADLERARQREEKAQEDLKHDELAEQANDILNEKEEN